MEINDQSSQLNIMTCWGQQSRGITKGSAILLAKSKKSSPGIFSKIGSAISGLFKSKPATYNSKSNDILRSYDMQSSAMHSTYEWKNNLSPSKSSGLSREEKLTTSSVCYLYIWILISFRVKDIWR